MARTLTASAEATKAPASMSTEHIAKHRENIVYREATSSERTTATKATARCIEAKLIVLLTLQLIV